MTERMTKIPNLTYSFDYNLIYIIASSLWTFAEKGLKITFWTQRMQGGYPWQEVRAKRLVVDHLVSACVLSHARNGKRTNSRRGLWTFVKSRLKSMMNQCFGFISW